MTIEVTPEAAEVLRRSVELGGVDPATGGVRLRLARGLTGGSTLQVELSEGPSNGEEVVESEGVRLFIDPSVLEDAPNATVDLEAPHDRIVLRPL